MMYCERINDPQYRIDLANLTKILGDSNAAVAALELNNGYSLDKTSNGNIDEDLKLDLLLIKTINPTYNQALIIDTSIKEKIIKLLDTPRFNKTIDTLFDFLNELSKTKYTTPFGRYEVLSFFKNNYYIKLGSDFEFIKRTLDNFGIINNLPNNYYNIDGNKVTLNKEVFIDVISKLNTNTKLVEGFLNSEKGKEVVSILEFLKNKTGIDYKIITEEEAKKILKLSNIPTSVNSFYINKCSYFIEGRSFNIDIASEEMLHPFVESIRLYNNVAYLSLVNECKRNFKKLHALILKAYPEKIVEEELLTLALARTFRENVKEYGVKANDAKQLVHNFINIILDIFESFFGENNSIITTARTTIDNILDNKAFSAYDLVQDITLNELAKLINSDLNIVGLDKAVHLKYNLTGLDQDTKDIISIIKYQGEKDGLDESVISLQIKSYLSGESWMVKNARTLIDKVGIRQAQLHVLGYDFNDEFYSESGVFNWEHYLGGIDLRDEIESSTPEFELRFSKLLNYQVDPAEIIMPKLYKSNFKFGDRSLIDITPEYFKRANSFYYSDLKHVKNGVIHSLGNIDFLIRCHSYKFNIAVLDKLSTLPGLDLKPVNMHSLKIENGYRFTESGERMYAVPEDITSWQLYRDSKGNETIVFKNNESYIKNIKKLIGSLDQKDLVSIQGFFDNINPSDEWINYIILHNHIKTQNGLLRQCIGLDPELAKLKLYEIYVNEDNAKRYKNDLANTLYNSFMRTLETISVRIPTQAFQSIMAAKVVGLTNDADNNVFVNRWQFWLQGSDLDIKQY